MDLGVLETIGLTNGEVRVYEALIHLGETTTGPIIERSGITGSKVYEILDKLIAKGLVSYCIRKKTKYFTAAPPTRIQDYVEEQEQELKKKKQDIAKLMPRLEQRVLKNKKTESVRMYEGYGGIKTALREILETMKKGEEYYAFSIGEEIENEKIRLHFENYHAKREKKNIRVQMIAPKKLQKHFTEIRKKKGVSIRYTKTIFPLGIILYKEHVLTLSLTKQPSAFLIQSKTVYETYKAYFKELWKQAAQNKVLARKS